MIERAARMTGLTEAQITAALGSGAPLSEQSTISATARVARMRSVFNRQMLDGIARWRGRVAGIEAGMDPWAGATASASKAVLRARALSELELGWHEIIDTAWKQAYRLGHAARTGEAPLSMPDAFLGRVEAQKRFASGFANDVANGVPAMPGRMSIGNRVGLYGNSLTGGFNAGAVDAGKPGEVIFWRLGACDHCPDCPVLALMGPYTKDTLPTMPRAGDTLCRMNCCCYLEFVGSADAGADAEPAGDQNVPLVDTALKQPKPPRGLRVPSDKEAKIMADLENRVNYSRRMIAQTKGLPEQRKWVAARREAATRLREFSQQRGIWSPPKFDVSEVVRGAKVKPSDVRDVTRVRGIDGRTARRGDLAARSRAVSAERDRLAKAVEQFPPESLGDIPDLEKLLVRAGAPPELFPGVGEAVGDFDAPAVTVLQSMGFGGAATLSQHVTALEVLVAGDYDVEVGPFGPDRWDLVPIIGTWIVGDPDATASFLAAWFAAVETQGSPAVGRWQGRV